MNNKKKSNKEEDIVEDLIKEIDSLSDSKCPEDRYVEKLPCNDLYKMADSLVDKNRVASAVMSDVERIEKDKLFNLVKSKGFSAEIVNKIKEELIEETAFLKSIRSDSIDSVEDIDRAIKITEKRTKILKDVLDVLNREEFVKSKKAKDEKIDFYSERFQRVFRYFLSVIQNTFVKVNIPTQYMEIFFTELAKEFEGFERKAEKLYYESIEKEEDKNILNNV